MKRFYCETCKRVKRVRNLPSDIRGYNEVLPSDRRGNCDWHSRSSVTNTTQGKMKAVAK